MHCLHLDKKVAYSIRPATMLWHKIIIYVWKNLNMPAKHYFYLEISIKFLEK